MLYSGLTKFCIEWNRNHTYKFPSHRKVIKKVITNNNHLMTLFLNTNPSHDPNPNTGIA